MQHALIVDPDAIAAEDTNGALLDAGITSTTVESAEDALQELRSGLYAILITETMLPGMGGAELCEMASGDVPIIVCSIDGSEASKVAAFCAGADDYVTKPASAAELRCRAKAVLRRSSDGCAKLAGARHARRESRHGEENLCIHPKCAARG